MENKLLKTITFDEPRKATLSGSEDEMTIAGVKFTAEHEQDCCERVYADFEPSLAYKSQVEEFDKISKIEIKSVENTGFIIFVYEAGSFYNGRIGILVNCYNQQNGYYSSDLTLKIIDGDTTTKIDIEKYDNID